MDRGRMGDTIKLNIKCDGGGAVSNLRLLCYLISECPPQKKLIIVIESTTLTIKIPQFTTEL